MIHKTKVIDDNLNPEWEDEKVLVGVNPDDTPDSTDMVIAVWDSDGPLLKVGCCTAPCLHLVCTLLHTWFDRRHPLL